MNDGNIMFYKHLSLKPYNGRYQNSEYILKEKL